MEGEGGAEGGTVRGWNRARRITRALAQLCGSALFKRSSGACWLDAEQEERANTAQLHFYRMLCGKTPLTHTSAWQLTLSYDPGGSTGLSHDHCNDLKGQPPQQARPTPTGWAALFLKCCLGHCIMCDAFGPQADKRQSGNQAAQIMQKQGQQKCLTNAIFSNGVVP